MQAYATAEVSPAGELRVLDRPSVDPDDTCNITGGADLVLDELVGRLPDLVAARVAARLAAPRIDHPEERLDTRRAAAYLGIHRDSLRRLAAARAIPAEQSGAGCKLFFRKSDLDTWRSQGSASVSESRAGGMADNSATPRRTRVERGIYRRPTGVFEVGFKDEDGRLRWRTVDGGILAARRLRDDLAARRARGESVAPNPKLRFGDAADQWLGGPVLDLRDTTQAKYQSIVNERSAHGWRRDGSILLPPMTLHGWCVICAQWA